MNGQLYPDFLNGRQELICWFIQHIIIKNQDWVYYILKVRNDFCPSSVYIPVEAEEREKTHFHVALAG